MDVTIECPCPARADGAARHPDGDAVTLRDRLDFRSATTIRKAIGLVSGEGQADGAEILAVMTEWYCLLGIEAWTLADEKGKPVPVTREAIRGRLLENAEAYAQTSIVADAADALYMPVVLLPLLARASTFSRPGPTPASTSAPKGSQVKRPRPLKPSSTTSTRTDATATISGSLDGDSSISPSSASAA